MGWYNRSGVFIEIYFGGCFCNSVNSLWERWYVLCDWMVEVYYRGSKNILYIGYRWYGFIFGDFLYVV